MVAVLEVALSFLLTIIAIVFNFLGVVLLVFSYPATFNTDSTFQLLSSFFVWINNIASSLILYSPLIVAIAAIITLYLAYLKEGKIYVGFHTYCICDRTDGLELQLPLGFYNTGATGKTIMGLRIKLKKDNWVSKPLYCEHTVNDMGIGADGKLKQTRKWISTFVVEPRKGYTDCFSFFIKKNSEDIKLNSEKYKIIFEAKFLNKNDWETIDIIDFYIVGKKFNCMTVYPNDPNFFGSSFETGEDSKNN